MIKVSGTTFHWGELIDKISVSNKGRHILKELDKNSTVYRYLTLQDLESTILIREHIIDAAKKLNTSNASFATFKNTKANDRYWTVTAQGGIRLRKGVKPSAAISDIFKNGDEYAFECATAMTVVYYYVLLRYLGAETFNNYFKDLYLYSWFTDSDLVLKIVTETDPIPGDVVYFDNPDNIKPQWQGENSVYLGDGLYYGHGMGVLSAKEMIEKLNTLGESDKEDAYILDKIVRPSFDHWSELKQRNHLSERMSVNRVVLYDTNYHHNQSSISYYYYCILVSLWSMDNVKITINYTLD
ncbi:protein-glutamine gamma-glutamyltransferase [Lentibacillus sp. CBA3610]|uniref:protein-glutamine gamma-glutamyltransferase n=1 Tax=Lentibacillus sp. CBA3610 TaxID=2518176 RepID=UPI0015958038|nr:protein-glutamine gamma-glutamyltransferase [Lentibacillus sp. CBA3610]QKY69338.1 protein-glutamine gamma-glutamyltransferase [Lentibacillus sp. CBA3610]